MFFPKAPFVIAHRGASFYAPENTLSAFLKAKELQFKWVEFDVRLTACGEVVVFHDELLQRTTNGVGRIQHFPYSYLKTLDAGSWFDPIFKGEPIPTLKEVLELLNTNNLGANIEIKIIPETQIELVMRVIEMLETMNLQIPILVSSFSYASLTFLKTHAPEISVGFLMDKYANNWRQCVVEVNAKTINLNHTLLTRELIQEIKATPSLLCAYTVNDLMRAKTLFNWGVDAVFSDCPPAFVPAIL